MGMSYTGFGAPVTTKNLQANADLDLGGYDLIATDVKGDTAEFGEFIGGVGNFTNVLGSGNLDIKGTGNIKGLTTFQNAVQVNGALHVEGSINNVNIADNGEITTAQGVNGADFNGASITSTKFNGAIISATKFNGATIDTSGNVTGVKGTFSGAVTGTTGTFSNEIKGTKFTRTTAVNVTSGTPTTSSPSIQSVTCILPFAPSTSYTGSIKVYNGSTATRELDYYTSFNTVKTITIAATSTTTISFTNVKCLYVKNNVSSLHYADLTLV